MARKCGNCKGTGLEKCPECNGKGKILVYRPINPDAKFWEPCRACNRGKIRCRNPRCNGGYLED